MREQLPLAVGFGSTIALSPCRLWAVPVPPAGVVPLPDLLDDGWRDREWAGFGAGVSPAVVDPDELGSGVGAVPRVRVADGLEPGCIGIRPQSAIAARESAPLQLTARGRAVLLLLAAAVGVVVVVFAWFGAGSSATAARAAQPAQVTVHEGDTLWSIAGRVAPNRDPRAEVARLLSLNHLSSPALVPGQVLLTR